MTRVCVLPDSAVNQCHWLNPWPPADVRRSIRATPLIGLGDKDSLEAVLPLVPEMLVFSDYPHGESNASPMDVLEPALSNLDPAARAAFLRDNLAECFARMGDPLPCSRVEGQ
jgi:hypothetical protein